MTTATATIATAAEKAVRADYRAGLLPSETDRYEAAQAELLVRSEAVGYHLGVLALKLTARQVAKRAAPLAVIGYDR